MWQQDTSYYKVSKVYSQFSVAQSAAVKRCKHRKKVDNIETIKERKEKPWYLGGEYNLLQTRYIFI